MSEVAGYNDQMKTLVATLLQQMTAQLDQVEKQVMDQLRSQMNVEGDPVIQSALGVIRDEAVKRHQELIEDLNARGVLQSGIMVQDEQTFNKMLSSSEGQVVASRLGELQERLTQAIMSFAQARLQQGQLGASMTLDAASRAQQNALQARQFGIQTGMGLAGMQQQQSQFRAGQQFNWAQLGAQQTQWGEQNKLGWAGLQSDINFKNAQVGLQQAELTLREQYQKDTIALQRDQMALEDSWKQSEFKLQEQGQNYQRDYWMGSLDAELEKMNKQYPDIYQGLTTDLQAMAGELSKGTPVPTLVAQIDAAQTDERAKAILKAALSLTVQGASGQQPGGFFGKVRSWLNLPGAPKTPTSGVTTP